MSSECGQFYGNPITATIVDALHRGEYTSRSFLEATVDDITYRAEVTIEPSCIFVFDPDDTDCSFTLRRHRYKDIVSDLLLKKIHVPQGYIDPYADVVSLWVQSRHGEVHHPYIYAGAFFDAGFALLQQHGNIAGYFDRWCEAGPLNTNYQMFREEEKALRRLGIRDKKTRETYAAQRTWIGQRVNSLGYTCAEVRRFGDPGDGHMYVLFY